MRGNTMLCTVPYAASERDLEAPLLSSPQGMRICSTVIRADLRYALKATGRAMPSNLLFISFPFAGIELVESSFFSQMYSTV